MIVFFNFLIDCSNLTTASNKQETASSSPATFLIANVKNGNNAIYYVLEKEQQSKNTHLITAPKSLYKSFF